jgi:hypothetical protein
VEVASGGTVVSSATGKGSTSAPASNGIAKSSSTAGPGSREIETEKAIENEPKISVIPDPPKVAPTTPLPPIDAAPKSRAGGPEERQAVLQDPEMRRIFDELEARLVEVRITPDSPEDIGAPKKSEE